MKPHLHAKGSAKRYGGVPEDYLDIHEFMDSTKSSLADHRHRAILHSTFGIFLVEKVFGSTRKNSADKVYSVRDVCEDHVIEDLGRIPTMEQWLRNMKLEPWMGGAERRKAKSSLKKRDEDKKVAEEITPVVVPIPPHIPDPYLDFYKNPWFFKPSIPRPTNEWEKDIFHD